MVIVIHFQPVELYPPIQNLIKFWSGYDVPLLVLTTSKELNVQQFHVGGKISIIRLVTFTSADSRLQRLFNYLQFYLKVLAILLRRKPKKVLYYETISSLPGLIYHWLFSNTDIFVHYHEYTSQQEYSEGMMLIKYLHKLERKRYRLMKWISHTNDYRLKLFMKDNGLERLPSMHVLPNYPPKDWIRTSVKRNNNNPLRFIYVGAVSLETMYFREVNDWINKFEGQAILDIYTLSTCKNVVHFFDSNPYIKLKPAVEYDLLPELFDNYDIGLILYKGHIPNYIYNAPNKLFEYLACGLDVWVPSVMKGSMQYVNSTSHPLVRSVDFEKLDTIRLVELVTPQNQEYTYTPSPYYMEREYKVIFTALQ